MRIAELSIRRYVLAFMASLVLVLFGIIAFGRIGVDRFPQIEFPAVSITTVLPGASPGVVDASITNIIESSVNSIPGIDFIQSRSEPGQSVVTVTFDLEKDVDVAFTEVQAKVNQVLRQLPDDIDPPVVGKVEVGAQAIYWMALSGDRTQQQLSQYARQVIKKRLETINGVGQVLIGGERRRTIRVNVDVDRMASLGVTAQDIRDAFREEHVQMPGGFLVGGPRERLIKLDLEFHSPETLGEMIVRYADGAPVRLRDFAQVEDGLADDRVLVRYAGKPTIGVGIVKIANANTVAIIDEVERRIDEELVPQLPQGLVLDKAIDESRPIREIVASLQDHLLEGTILAALIVWLFLRSWRSTLIIATAIPVSLLGAVAVMYFMGYTFNQMTLLGLLLLIGVVVDDAIVVLENIHRHREHIDPDPISAAIQGTRQVGFAVVAASLTLVSIFVSVLFMEGMIARFFRAFAVVVTIGVLVSLFVSVTLTPMLCSRFLDVSKSHGRIYHSLDGMFSRLDAFYRRVLAWTLAHRLRTIGMTSLVVLSSVLFFALTEKTFLPSEDDGRVIVAVRAPLGTSRAAMGNYLTEVEKVLATYPEVQNVFTAIGLGSGQVSTGRAVVVLTPRSKRARSQAQVIQSLRADLAQIPGILAFPSASSPVGNQRGEQMQFVVVGPDFERVADAARRLHAKLATAPAFASIDLDLQQDLPQLELLVDRTRAASAGLTTSDVAFTLNMLAGGLDIASYNDDPGDGDRYDVRVKALEGQLDSPDDLNRIFVRAPSSEMVRIDAVARIADDLGPAVINRYGLQYAANFYANPAAGLGTAVREVQSAAAEVLPAGYHIELTGPAREFSRIARSLMLVFVLAITLVYIVLASQFNSFIQPIVVMTAQPLAVVGGLFALWVAGSTLNIFSMIGMVLLMGLVAKNSILLVDLTNQMRAEGKPIDEALLAACPVRLRPVLMTSLTVILALMPAALGFGAGAQTNGPLAIAVVGGMVSSTVLTLIVVPAVYSIIERALETWRGERRIRTGG